MGKRTSYFGKIIRKLCRVKWTWWCPGAVWSNGFLWGIFINAELDRIFPHKHERISEVIIHFTIGNSWVSTDVTITHLLMWLRSKQGVKRLNFHVSRMVICECVPSLHGYASYLLSWTLYLWCFWRVWMNWITFTGPQYSCSQMKEKMLALTEYLSYPEPTKYLWKVGIYI